MQIELVKIGKPFVDGKFTKMEVEYIRDGKNYKPQKLVGVGKTMSVIKSLQSNFQGGDIVEIELEKNGDFYNWVGITKVENVAAAPEKKSSYQKQSTYETPEERAMRQIYIARQNSVTNAVALHTAKDGKPQLVDVLNTAQALVDFVINGEVPEAKSKQAKSAGKIPDVPADDIPF